MVKPCTGVLEKEDYFNKKRTTRWPQYFQKRYFVLKGAELKWFADKGKEELGAIDLTRFRWLEGGEGSTSPRGSDLILEFEAFQTNKERSRPFILQALSPDQHTEWKEMFEEIRQGSVALVIKHLSIESSNSMGHKVAKIGDKVRLRLETSEPVLPPRIELGVPVEAVPAAEVGPEGSCSAWSAEAEVTVGQHVQGPVQLAVECEPVQHWDCMGQARQKAAATDAELVEPGGAPGVNVHCEMTVPEVLSLTMSSDNPYNCTIATVGSTITAVLAATKPVLPPEIVLTESRVPMPVLTQEAAPEGVRVGRPTIAAKLAPADVIESRSEWKAALEVTPAMGFLQGPVTVFAGGIMDPAGNLGEDVYEVFRVGAEEGEAGMMFLSGAPSVTSIRCRAEHAVPTPPIKGPNGEHCDRVAIGDVITTTVKFNRPVSGVCLALGEREARAEAGRAEAGPEHYTGDDGTLFSFEWTFRTPVTVELDEAPRSSEDGPRVFPLTFIPVAVEAGYFDEVGVKGESARGPKGGSLVAWARPYTLEAQDGDDVAKLSSWMLDILHGDHSRRAHSSDGQSPEGGLGGLDHSILDLASKRVKELGEYSSGGASEAQLVELLKDGVVLCWVALKLGCQMKGGGASITTDAIPPGRSEFDHTVLKLRAKHRENIAAFLLACKEFQVPSVDLFTPEDLLEGRTGPVMKCMASVARHVYHIPQYCGPVLGAPHRNGAFKKTAKFAVVATGGLWGKAGGGHYNSGPNTKAAPGLQAFSKQAVSALEPGLQVNTHLPNVEPRSLVQPSPSQSSDLDSEASSDWLLVEEPSGAR